VYKTSNIDMVISSERGIPFSMKKDKISAGIDSKKRIAFIWGPLRPSLKGKILKAK
jgi:hypothetical protein